MQRVAVRFFKDLDSNPKGLPPGWPARIREMGQHEACPYGWTEMSVESLDKLKTSMRSEVDLALAKYQDKIRDLKADLPKEDKVLVKEVEKKIKSLEKKESSWIDKLLFWRS